MSMHRDRFVLALVATALVVVGIFALNWPTSLDDYDTWGFRISCGSGLAADFEQAEIADRADGSTDYVAQCGSAIGWRRAWSGAVVLLGAGLSTALVLRWQRAVPADRGPG